MSYTKGEMIDQVYLAVSGGQPTPDVNVKRADIAAYLTQAINYVTVKEIRNRKREDESQAIDPEFYQTYPNITPTWDSDRRKYYIVLPERLQAIPSGQGIGSVAAMGSDLPYVRLRSPYEATGIGHIFQQAQYWYEKLSGDNGQERLYFNNIGYPIPTMLLRMIASFESLANDDVVTMPSGMEIEVLELAKQWFVAQRQLPADMINNNNDDKK